MDQSDLRIGEFEMGMTSNPEKSADSLLRNLKHANPNVLRIALFQATSDPELAAMRVEKQSFWGGSFEVPVLCTEHVAVVEEKALTFLMKAAEFRPSEPSDRDLRAMMEMFMGEPVSDFFY